MIKANIAYTDLMSKFQISSEEIIALNVKTFAI